jgi:hypothetical protein
LSFELLLFTVDPLLASVAMRAGADGIIVDWENRGKPDRQRGADTQINFDTHEDLCRVRQAVEGTVICRINGYDPESTPAEIENAIECGADEILLPMVRSREQVERTLDLVRERCRTGILIETSDAVERAVALGRLPLARIYVGLNDLSIDRKTSCIFTAMADGTVDHVRSHIHVPFGVAGLTLPELGAPVACRLIIGELARLGCSFSFLRRSFWKDIADRDMDAEVPRIKAAIESARTRTPGQVEHDRREFRMAVAGLENPRPTHEPATQKTRAAAAHSV